MRQLHIVDVDRPQPSSYFGQRAAELLDWETCLWRFEAEESYWLATMSDRPHSMPVWGIWQQAAFRFIAHHNTKKARNLIAKPFANVHSANPETVLILECDVAEVTAKDELQQFVDDYNPKYKRQFAPDDVAGTVFALTPHTAFAWSTGTGPGSKDSATRWRFNVID